MKTRVLTIAPQPFFSPRGTPFSVYYRALVLSELGVENDILTYGRGQDVDIPGVRVIRIPEFKWLGPIKVGPSILKLYFDLLLFPWAIRLLAKNRYDFVHAHEESVFLCLALHRMFKIKFVYDMHSSLPQQLVNFKFTRSRLLIGLFEKLEQSSLDSADAVITISPDLAKYARSLFQDEKSHFLIENSIFDEVQLKNEASEGETVTDWESRIPESRPIVAYAGTFESYQGIDLLIRAFAVLRQSSPNSFLLLIGGTEKQQHDYQNLAFEEGIEGDCLFTGQVNQRQARQLLHRASVLVSPRIEGTNTPLKIYEHLASGIPLVATDVPSHTQVLRDEICFLADPEPSLVAEALHEALTNEERRESVVRSAKELYERRYSRGVYKGKMTQVLQALR